MRLFDREKRCRRVCCFRYRILPLKRIETASRSLRHENECLDKTACFSFIQLCSYFWVASVSQGFVNYSLEDSHRFFSASSNKKVNSSRGMTVERTTISRKLSMTNKAACPANIEVASCYFLSLPLTSIGRLVSAPTVTLKKWLIFFSFCYFLWDVEMFILAAQDARSNIRFGRIRCFSFQ